MDLQRAIEGLKHSASEELRIVGFARFRNFGRRVEYDEGRGVAVLYGGEYNSPCTDNYEDTWEYDGNDWKEVATNPRPPARFGSVMAYDIRRKVTLLHGGSGCAVHGDTWEFDGKGWLLRHRLE